ncbi:DUF4179 domain-containing protein [Paenibacillus glufosinatiresistens]|uniref:DUF4179 domain-containing protein n=1 Tax=Paenibacillus glufosinatiresistens TaxID=3070657 RepID=UPI00286E22B6|nr:DUF4179 domain-containing protein [Paenibacillus sp. YX.27]
MKSTQMPKDNDLEFIKRLLNEDPVTIDLVKSTMDRYHKTDLPSVPVPSRRSKTRFVFSVASLAAVMLFTLPYLSPTMAASMKQVPVLSTLFQFIGDLGLRTADERGWYTSTASQDSHNGISLQVPVVMFDGTRLSLGIERMGQAESTSLPLQSQIKSIHLSIDGRDIQDFQPSQTDNSIDIYSFQGRDKNSSVLEFSDLRNQGGEPFPDHFRLSLEVILEGVDQPYALTVPVRLNVSDLKVYSPHLKHSYQNLTVDLEKVEVTPVTTSISLRLTVDPSDSRHIPLMGYDLFDESGHKLNFLTSHSWNPTDGLVQVTDARYEPLNGYSKTIVIKPYLYLYKDPANKEMIISEDGTPKIRYIPELEMRVALK